MKKKKPMPVRKNVSMGRPLKVVIAGFVVLALFFVFYKTDKEAPKTATPSTEQKSVCSPENFPVCGKDGRTYTNSCTAEKIADVRIAYVGACREEKSEPTEANTPTRSGSEVDSGIENIGPVPKYTTDREDTGSLDMSSGAVPESISTLSGTTDSASGLIDPTLITYTNSTYHYGFSMPKNSYYQAFGVRNGASHSVGIMTGTWVESLSGSEVRVYFYANKIVEKLSGAENWFYTDPTTHTIYLLLDNKDSVAIESNDPEGKLVQTIIRTIHKEP